MMGSHTLLAAAFGPYWYWFLYLAPGAILLFVHLASIRLWLTGLPSEYFERSDLLNCDYFVDLRRRLMVRDAVKMILDAICPLWNFLSCLYFIGDVVYEKVHRWYPYSSVKAFFEKPLC